METSVSTAMQWSLLQRVDPEDISFDVTGKKKTVVLFDMATCPYCRMFERRFSEFAMACREEFSFLCVTLNDPQNPLWQRYELRAVPTVIVFAEGKIVTRLDSVLFLGIIKRHWTEFRKNIPWHYQFLSHGGRP